MKFITNSTTTTIITTTTTKTAQYVDCTECKCGTKLSPQENCNLRCPPNTTFKSFKSHPTLQYVIKGVPDIGPLPPTIHRGLEWPQVLNSLFVCLSVCLFVCLSVLCKFSNFFVQYKAAGVRKNVVRMNTDVLI